MTTALPFDDFRALLAKLPGPNEKARTAVLDALAGAADPVGELGSLAAWLAAWSDRGRIRVDRPMVAIFAATHGHSLDGIRETESTVARIGAGQSPLAGICSVQDVGLKVFDLALHLPTADLQVEAALDERGCAGTMAFGMEAIAGGSDVIALGGIGDCDGRSSAALAAALTREDPDLFTSAGDAPWADAVRSALALHGSWLADPLEALRRLGGREHAAMAGAILAARMERVPIILDGSAALVAAAVIFRLSPTAVAHCVLAAPPAGEGYSRLAAEMSLSPLLRPLDAAAGVSGALAIDVVRSAAGAFGSLVPRAG